ncbi:Fe2+-enterobactin ABC transporter substrate-binding protein, partial [Salmonella enterica]|nr:Fe2+-enterobactin ABC transporter substrate-binding protein [Salmonella enterica]
MRLPAFYRWLLLVVGISISGISLAQDAGWPRQIQDSRGVHTLDHKPARIVSTSVTLTGSLLATTGAS